VGAVVVRLPCPGEFVQNVHIEPVAIGLPLRFEHQVANLVCREGRFSAALKNRFFEDKTGINIHDGLGIAGNGGLEDRQLFAWIADSL